MRLFVSPLLLSAVACQAGMLKGSNEPGDGRGSSMFVNSIPGVQRRVQGGMNKENNYNNGNEYLGSTTTKYVSSYGTEYLLGRNESDVLDCTNCEAYYIDDSNVAPLNFLDCVVVVGSAGTVDTSACCIPYYDGQEQYCVVHFASTNATEPYRCDKCAWTAELDQAGRDHGEQPPTQQQPEEAMDVPSDSSSQNGQPQRPPTQQPVPDTIDSSTHVTPPLGDGGIFGDAVTHEKGNANANDVPKKQNKQQKGAMKL